MGQFNYIKGSVEKTAALLIAEAAKTGVEAHHLAQRKIEECQAANDEACMKFWRNVWIHIMSHKYSPGTPAPDEDKLLDDDSGDITV